MGVNTNKCLEFRLPSGGGGMPAGITQYKILRKIKQFAKQYSLEFKHKSMNHRVKVWFPKEEHYTLFFLVSEPEWYWEKPTIQYEYYQED